MAYDLYIAAATLYMEASSEPLAGQKAVAHVLVNRLKDGRWGRTLSAVCLASSQFSCWNTNDPNRKRMGLELDFMLTPYEKIITAARNGSDPSNVDGALYYFNPASANPTWAAGFILTATIGKHVFYKEPV